MYDFQSNYRTSTMMEKPNILHIVELSLLAFASNNKRIRNFFFLLRWIFHFFFHSILVYRISPIVLVQVDERNEKRSKTVWCSVVKRCCLVYFLLILKTERRARENKKCIKLIRLEILFIVENGNFIFSTEYSRNSMEIFISFFSFYLFVIVFLFSFAC